MSSSKYNSFWPLLGRVDDFATSLQQALTFTLEKNPAEAELIQWYHDTYKNATRESTVRSHINAVPEHSGLFEVEQNRLKLSEEGKKHLGAKNNRMSFEILDKNVLGFSKTVKFLGSNLMDINDLQKVLSNQFIRSQSSNNRDSSSLTQELSDTKQTYFLIATMQSSAQS